MNLLSKISFLFAAMSLLSLIFIRYLLGEWVPFCWIALGLFVIFSLLPLWIDRLFFKSFFSLKTTRQGFNMGTVLFLALIIFSSLNILAFRHGFVFDFSVGSNNSLSPQSLKLLKSLDSELKVLFFYKKGVEGNDQNRKSMRELIKKYQDESSWVQLHFIEVNENPDIAKDYGVDKGSGTAFLDYKGRRSRVEKIDEQELSSALVKATRQSDKILYYVLGHGERDLEDSQEATGMALMKSLLENSRYAVKKLDLPGGAQIPADASGVLVVAPLHQFQSFELDALQSYVEKGGSLFLALESQQNTGLEKWLEKFGVYVENNYVMNLVNTPLGRGVNQGSTMGSVFSSKSAVTKPFGEKEFTLFRYPMGLRTVEKNLGEASLEWENLVSTSADTVGFDSFKFTGSGDKGPFVLGVQVQGALKKESKPFSLFVFGDADFISNQLLYKNLNRDLFLNSVAYLSKEENLISISPKDPLVSTLNLNPTSMALFIFLFALPLPLGFLSMALFLWWKRRGA